MACGQEKKSKRVRSEAERGAVTDQFGQYGVIKEADMWDKRPEFMLWCSEVRCCVCGAGWSAHRWSACVWHTHSDGGDRDAQIKKQDLELLSKWCAATTPIRAAASAPRPRRDDAALTREDVAMGGGHAQGGEGDVQGVHGGLQHRNIAPQEGIPTPRASRAPRTLRSSPWASV